MGGDGGGRSGGRPTVEDSVTNKDRRAKTKDKANARPAREAMFSYPAEMSAAGRGQLAQRWLGHNIARDCRSRSEMKRRSFTASFVLSPCRYMPLRSPFGPPPPAPWKRQTVQPVTAGAMHGRLVRFEVAEQRGLFWNG